MVHLQAFKFSFFFFAFVVTLLQSGADLISWGWPETVYTAVCHLKLVIVVACYCYNFRTTKKACEQRILQGPLQLKGWK